MAFNKLLTYAKRLGGGIGAGSPPDVSEQLTEIFARTPVPLVWLIGKTQAGKSSVVRTITGFDDVEIGQGFCACTRNSSIYPYPSQQAPLLRFLDTRGLFEAGYSAEEDMAVFEKQAHLLLVVVKANDHALGGLVELLEKIKKRHRDWPVLVVQTCLHELYSPPGSNHPEPYPFADCSAAGQSSAGAVASEVWRSLSYQRQTLAKFSSHFVAVDFTLPGDQIEPADYGQQQLLDALNELLPEVAWNLIKQQGRGEVGTAFWRKAQPHIVSYSVGCGLAAASPIPFSDIPLVTAVQLKMLHSVAGVYGQKMTYERLTEVLGALGFSYLSSLGWRGLLKFIPGGSIAYGTYCTAATYALGNAFCAYFQYLQDGIKPDKEVLRALFAERLSLAGSVLAKGQTTGESQVVDSDSGN